VGHLASPAFVVPAVVPPFEAARRRLAEVLSVGSVLRLPAYLFSAPVHSDPADGTPDWETGDADLDDLHI
jgi:hypothetical protein